MRASRLLSVLMLLQTRGKLTARELADELEVSVRTVHRDLESLAEAGVPVVAERGVTGGYRLLAGYRTRLTGLTAPEADSLFFAGLPTAADDLGLGALAAAAELKLLAALPPPLRERAARARDRFHLDAPGWFRAAEQIPLLADVAAAVWAQQRLRVTYHRWRTPREVERLLDPLGVVLKSGTWYLVAVSSTGDQAELGSTAGAMDAPQPADHGNGLEPRTYRVSRILALTATGERFERPPDFDLASCWAAWTARYESGVYRAEATVRLSPTGMTMAPFRLAPAISRAIRDSAGEPEADGWVLATIPIESVRHATGELLALGADIEVLQPPDLRAALTHTAASLAALYGPPAHA
ncbi:putative transcriptional regulator [Frankia sp. AiPs1]|uniref:helix-turn-helix transcriptional regulator n=1 Tax=Frankia sp. AiPa1 TaxID=573492 RepID=UPI00202B42DD|nr:WYL domain-containing protein [Frankia sp. AiPa1]MCL9761978.1 WYL domain-containing protein [Frankia sp. AiPa1]